MFRTLDSDEGMHTMDSDLYDDHTAMDADTVIDDEQLSSVHRHQAILKSVSTDLIWKSKSSQ